LITPDKVITEAAPPIFIGFAVSAEPVPILMEPAVVLEPVPIFNSPDV
jgi:hypothetical protein